MSARLRWGLSLSVVVVLLHLWALTWWLPAPSPLRPTPTPAVTVWSLRPALPAPGGAPAREEALTERRRSAPVDAQGPLAATPATTPRIVDSAPERAGAPPAEAGERPGIELPLYATALPGALHWRYQLQRGTRSGVADLRWSPGDDGSYVLNVNGQVDGAPAFEWLSRGQVDAGGLAPERFVARRRGRGAQAANFEREAGKITYSGPRVERALPAAAQDRASWLLQLASIVEADSSRFVRGQLIHLYVTGARGDADVWTFEVHGAQAVSLGEATSGALHLVRVAPRPYETRAEVWLDPARRHMPVRVHLGVEGASQAPLEMRLLEAVR